MSSVIKAFQKLITTTAAEAKTEEPVVWDESDEYITDHVCSGVALIIINESFRGHKNRSGSQFDAENLCHTFSLLGFDVRLVRDCSLAQLKKALSEVAREDHSNSDCFVLAMSSHGDEFFRKENSAQFYRKVREDIVFCTDLYMTTRELILHFSDDNSPTLQGKPRLFFLQACRGDQLDPSVEVKVVNSVGDRLGDEEVDGAGTEMVVSPAPCFKDFLIMCATPPGYYAFRRPTDGSWFVQALCSVLKTCESHHDVLHLLTRVVYDVAHRYESWTPKDITTDKKKQTPCIYTMLTKDLYWKVKEQPGRITIVL